MKVYECATNARFNYLTPLSGSLSFAILESLPQKSNKLKIFPNTYPSSNKMVFLYINNSFFKNKEKQWLLKTKSPLGKLWFGF